MSDFPMTPEGQSLWLERLKRREWDDRMEVMHNHNEMAKLVYERRVRMEGLDEVINDSRFKAKP